jgi:hypothetical protein
VTLNTRRISCLVYTKWSGTLLLYTDIRGWVEMSILARQGDEVAEGGVSWHIARLTPSRANVAMGDHCTLRAMRIPGVLDAGWRDARLLVTAEIRRVQDTRGAVQNIDGRQPTNIAASVTGAPC